MEERATQQASDVIGRSAELAAIERLLARVAEGCAGLVFGGEAGIGKTTVWQAARARAAERGFSVVASRPALAEARLPLGGFGDLFAEVPGAVVAQLPAPQRRALDVALVRVDATGGAADQRTLSVATVGLLRELAAEAPLLVAIDDAQWLDESSAAILAYAARRLDGSRVGFLLSLRGGEAAGDPLGLASALPSGTLEREQLGPLSLAALHRLFLARLGHSFPRLILIGISDAAAGNPFYALEIARALERSGAVATPGARLPVPPTLAALMDERIGALSARTRAALLLAASAAEATLATLAAAGGTDPESALRPAVRDGVVEIAEETVRFTHPLLAQAVLNGVDARTLRRAHAKLAATAQSADARARHLGEAATGPDEAAADALEQAARSARDRGASLDAVALFERASVLTPVRLGDRAAARAILAAEGAFIDLSDFHYADAILERALERGGPGTTRAEMLSLRAIVWYFHGRQSEATRLCEQALEAAIEPGVARAKVLLRCAYLHGQVDMERSQAEVVEAAQILERETEPVDPDLLAAALLDRANAALQMATGLRRRDIERGTRLHTAAGRTWEWERADANVYELARHTDDLTAALAKLMEQLERRANRGGEDPFAFVHVSLMNAWLGDWKAARSWAERAVEGYEREGADLWPAFALRGLALVEALEGRVDEARRLSRRGLALATESGDLVVAILHRQILALVALSTGELAEADAELEAAAALAEQVGARHPLRFRLDGDRAEVALALGDLDRARGIVERLEEAGRAAPTPWTLAVGARSRALLEAAHGELDAALTALERALVEHERLPMPFERARTLLVKGQVHHRRKEKRLAHSSLREAARSFDELGSALWAERARVELERVPLRRREPDELTETERRVAQLAADGLSNQDIAQRAFVSVKTVEASLTRVYRKLGVRSRGGLGRALAERGQTSDPQP